MHFCANWNSDGTHLADIHTWFSLHTIHNFNYIEKKLAQNKTNNQISTSQAKYYLSVFEEAKDAPN